MKKTGTSGPDDPRDAVCVSHFLTSFFSASRCVHNFYFWPVTPPDYYFWATGYFNSSLSLSTPLDWRCLGVIAQYLEERGASGRSGVSLGSLRNVGPT